MQAAITALQGAETATLTRLKGAVATRNEKRTALVALLQQLKAYVQSLADANPENAPSIIRGAGYAIRKPAVRAPRTFAARAGNVSGTVKIIAPAAGRRAAYDWQYSADGGKTWTSLPSTLQARTSLAGLAVASTVEFRYRAIVKTGEGDWSQPTSILVT